MGYMIICLSLIKTQFGKFELEILSDQKIKRITSNINFNNIRKTIELKGFWGENTSGGSPNEISFNRNPKYLLTTDLLNINAFIEISSKEKYSIGIKIVEVLKDTFEIDLGKNKDSLNSFVFREEYNFLQIQLEMNKKYILIPFTYNSNQKGQFEIKIWSKDVFEINEIANKKYSSFFEFKWLIINENVAKKLAELFRNSSNKITFKSFYSIRLNFIAEGSVSFSCKQNLRFNANMIIFKINNKKEYEVISERENCLYNGISL